MAVPTGGAWPGVVGASGYLLCDYNGGSFGAAPDATNDVKSLPSGCSVAASGLQTFLFGTTTEPTGSKWLENAAGTSASGGSWFCSGASTVTFTFASGFTGVISIYCCDYDAGGRGQTVKESTTGTTFTIPVGTAFQNGQWEQWTVTIGSGGTSVLTITPSGGNGQALISGVFFDASGGGSSSSVTASDSVTVSDSPTRTAAHPRATADAVTVSDSATRTAGHSRAVNDAVTFSDAATIGQQSWIEGVSDTATVTDLAARTVAMPRATLDAVTFSDAATGIKTKLVTATDTITVSSTLARGPVTQARTASDTIGCSDSTPGHYQRTTGDLITISDIAGRGGPSAPFARVPRAGWLAVPQAGRLKT